MDLFLFVLVCVWMFLLLNLFFEFLIVCCEVDERFISLYDVLGGEVGKV